MLTLQEYLDLSESLSIVDNELVFDYNDRSGEQKTSFGKNKRLEPYMKADAAVSGLKVYSAYKATSTDILKALKKKNNINISTEDYEQFINRTGLYVARILKKEGVDVILAPTSSSYLLDDILDNLSSRLSGIKVVKSAFKKVDASKIDQIKIRQDLPGLTPKIEKGLESILKKAKKDGYFEIKKVDKRFAKYLTGYFEVVDSYILDKLTDQRVVVFDDVISSGATFNEMLIYLHQIPTSNLYGFTIFKT